MSTDDINSKSREIESRLWQLIEERQPDSIMFYIAFGSEARTQNCIVQAINSGRITLVPICVTEPPGITNILPSRLLDPGSEVAEGRFGVPEPKPEFRRPFPPEKIDLVVVPGVAFDERGYRIGHGAGYYDHFLLGCSRAFLVGLAYEIQIVKDALPEVWDSPVHEIITEDRIILCRPCAPVRHLNTKNQSGLSGSHQSQRLNK